MAPLKRLLYFILKLLFYVHFKSENCSWTVGSNTYSFPSYFCKTVYFHYLLRKSIAWWESADEDKLIQSSLREIFKLMGECVQRKHCESFFIRGLQIVRWNEVPDMVVGKIVAKCDALATEPLNYLPQMNQHEFHCLHSNIDCLMLFVEARKQHGRKQKIDLSEEIIQCVHILLSRFPIKTGNISPDCYDVIKHFIIGLDHYRAYIFRHCNNKYEPGEEDHVTSIQREFGTSLYRHVFSGAEFSFSQNAEMFIKLGKVSFDYPQTLDSLTPIRNARKRLLSYANPLAKRSCTLV